MMSHAQPWRLSVVVCGAMIPIASAVQACKWCGSAAEPVCLSSASQVELDAAADMDLEEEELEDDEAEDDASGVSQLRGWGP